MLDGEHHLNLGLHNPTLRSVISCPSLRQVVTLAEDRFPLVFTQIHHALSPPTDLLRFPNSSATSLPNAYDRVQALSSNNIVVGLSPRGIIGSCSSTFLKSSVRMTAFAAPRRATYNNNEHQRNTMSDADIS